MEDIDLEAQVAMEQQAATGDGGSKNDAEEEKFLTLCRSAHTESTDYMDANLRRQIEKNLHHFRNEHAPGSRFKLPAYKNRSTTFRPKTREIIRNKEAGVAMALHSTADQVHVEASDPDNPQSLIAAQVNKMLLENHLEKNIPWFITSVGAAQDAMVQGLCISYNHWRHEKRKIRSLLGQDENGKPVYEYKWVTVKDHPDIELQQVENIRFSPTADWRNPIQTSPYVRRYVPMHIHIVREKMDQGDWHKHDNGKLMAASKESWDSTRMAREGEKRVDPQSDTNQIISDYRTVWCVENFFRIDGEELVWWTVGQEVMLTDPTPISEIYPHGERPLTAGFMVLETHRNHPSADAELIGPLQEDANKIANQRFDNVELALNSRYFIRRGEQVDLPALMRNVPGGGIMVDDVDKSVKSHRPNDVTGSSYQEQDRLDLQMDSLAGNFSASSVQTNRKLNETVGGMEMISQASGGLSDYSVRLFVETWVEPTLRQILKLIQHLESDVVVIEVAAQKADIYKKYQDEIGAGRLTEIDQEYFDALMKQDLTLNVNVGLGNTNPMQRMQKLTAAVQTAIALDPNLQSRINGDEIRKEVFGAAGYKDGNRFFVQEEELPEPQPGPMDFEMQKAQMLIDAENGRHEARLQLDRELGFASLAAKENMTMRDLLGKLDIAEQTNATRRDIEALKETTKQNELDFKAATGRPGI